MLKHSLPIVIGLLFATVAINSSATLPPKYLGIKDFKQCLGSQKFDTHEGWCMPAKKLETCPAKSWEQLKGLTGKEKLPKCPSNSNLVTPAPAAKPMVK